MLVDDALVHELSTGVMAFKRLTIGKTNDAVRRTG